MSSICMVLLAALIASPQGCATQIALPEAAGPGDSNALPVHQALLFQNSSIEPKGSNALLSPDSLRPGDIILTSASSLASTGIQLMTLAPVSHAALYVGEERIVDATRPGVQARPLDELLAEATVALALRYPELSAEQGQNIRDYALQKTGTGFNFIAVTLHVPFSVKRVCELPLVPPALRDACIRSIGVIHYLAASESQLFCSQLVLQAYQRAGVPITDADPRLISPADILHMREGDVPSIRIHKPLRYVGHLKYEPVTVVALEQ